jgi:hypothetical protein
MAKFYCRARATSAVLFYCTRVRHCAVAAVQLRRINSVLPRN